MAHPSLSDLATYGLNKLSIVWPAPVAWGVTEAVQRRVWMDLRLDARLDSTPTRRIASAPSSYPTMRQLYQGADQAGSTQA